MVSHSFRSLFSRLGLKTRLWTSIFWSAPIFLDSYLFPRERSEHYNREFGEHVFDAVYIAYQYEGDLAQIIYHFKYAAQRHNIHSFSPGIDTIMREYIPPEDINNIIFVYVPFGWYQIFTRPYNHSHIIAEYIVHKFSSSGRVIPKLRNLLFKKKITEHQAHLSKEERIINTRDAFMLAPWINPDTIDGRTVCLIDDVISSGSTLRSIAHVFRSCGAKKIMVIALASPLR